MWSRLAGLAAGAALALAVGAVSAGAATREGATITSANWAGYTVASGDPAAGAAPEAFTRVLATWTQPAATCAQGSPTYAAFWVGLGGYAKGTTALEQTGTESDCTVFGLAHYSAWYELVPAPPVAVPLVVSPGDALAASVTVIGKSVFIRLVDSTRGTLFTRRVKMNAPDLSSAEWIAEAPSGCGNLGCRALPLTNFGTVSFGTARATGDGHTGTISGPAWAADSVLLQGSAGQPDRGRFAGATPPADAVPGALSADGASFSVAWQQEQPGPTPP